MVKAENCMDGSSAFNINSNSNAYMTEDCDFVIRTCGTTVGYSTSIVRKKIIISKL